MNRPERGQGLLDKLNQAIIVETIREQESAGPLEDKKELRQAFVRAGSPEERVALRARLLGQRQDLNAQLLHLRQWILGALLCLALLMAAGGLLTARGVLTDGRQINVLAAFFALLGVHAVSLLLWLLGLLWSLRAAPRSRGPGAWSFGQWIMRLIPAILRRRRRQAVQLLQAFHVVMRRQHLWRWLLGMMSHAVWTLALGLAFLALLFGFSFRNYQMRWETTILSPDFFDRFVAVVSWLPSRLGVTVPDAGDILQQGADVSLGASSAQSQAWAWWLLACLLIYGFLPRLLLTFFCAWRWLRGVARMPLLDLGDPVMQTSLRRFEPLQPLAQVLDPEAKAVAQRSAISSPGAQAQKQVEAMALGFELPAEIIWPPQGLPAHVCVLGNIAGSASQQDQALLALADAHPETLLLFCHSAATPDRGTARFMHELSACCDQLCMMLLTPPDRAAEQQHEQRWQQWLRAQPGLHCGFLHSWQDLPARAAEKKQLQHV